MSSCHPLVGLPRKILASAYIGSEREYWASSDMVFDSHKGMPLTVKAYFMSDGFSIPKPVQFIFSKAPRRMMPAFLHDLLYRKDCPYDISRKQADRLLIFYMALYDQADLREIKGRWKRLKFRAGCAARRQIMHSALWAGGWANWKKKESQFYNECNS